ncbi:hypothetical protein AB0B50_21230 [Streptomyces sp. NPDC041068]|uniref:hypothetical protein n=1 Tax=Streptomyces sp. NPDC041068 TaxID=3155130 RepID=UPI0033CCD775
MRGITTLTTFTQNGSEKTYAMLLVQLPTTAGFPGIEPVLQPVGLSMMRPLMLRVPVAG